ncbi:PREDICTED: RNA-binding protein 28 isoform X2 [Cyprinodon variegatus]|uniref:RNA-binding protein 28 isoform X2 n=1 Tax=Cyprinodon variegatus TaxID=28743 RepID=UPI0007429AF8|nr:PREDICTED: RNA-binding protein 28 isoform X2 [Cyprinodon variegatus]
MPAMTIFVASLPETATNERLEEIFSEVGPVKQCFVVREKGTEKCRGFGFVTYSMEEDAHRALKEVKEYDGKKLSLSVAKKKMREKKTTEKEEPGPSQEKKETTDVKQKISKQARLVIRNLSFKCTEDDLKEVFGKFGTVVEANIALKPDGKMRGFAFVQFKNMSGATKALQAMNLKEIKGRQVAVDWAVPKEKYIAAQQSLSSGSKAAEETDPKTGSNSEEEKKQGKKQETTEKKKGLKAAAQPVEDLQSSDEENLESDEEDDDDDDNDDDDDDDEDDEDDIDEETEDDNEQDEMKEEDDYDTDDDNESEDEREEEISSARKKKPRKNLSSDVKEGRTVFIRNLSFDTEEDGLEEALLQFGELNYVKIVLHPDTQHSKGLAFAQFKTKEAADGCIAAAKDETENGGIRVDGRKLMVVAAVSREDAMKLKVDKKKVETGSRNLYLAREGLIRAGTKAAEGVSEADMAKRVRFEEIKRAKLRDVNVFVSKNRLCVHNLPKSVDNKKLKALCLQGLKGVKGVRITEPEKGQVMGQSLGYGFVQFQDHEQALATLRYLNNNPDIFSPHKRPIVEFSLEDSRKLKLKEMRKQRNKEIIKNRTVKEEIKMSQMGSDTKRPKKGGNKDQSSSLPTGKKKASSEGQKQHFSGFQTQPEVEHVDLKNGKKRKKVLPLPSHRGPKIRMRDKEKQQAPPAKKAKPGSKRNRRQRQIEKPTQTRKQLKTGTKQFKRRDGDRFDSLVEQYKRKLMGGSDKNASFKRNKWFDG